MSHSGFFLRKIKIQYKYIIELIKQQNHIQFDIRVINKYSRKPICLWNCLRLSWFDPFYWEPNKYKRFLVIVLQFYEMIIIWLIYTIQIIPQNKICGRQYFLVQQLIRSKTKIHAKLFKTKLTIKLSLISLYILYVYMSSGRLNNWIGPASLS